MLKYKADLISILYMIVTTGLLVLNWMQPEFNIILWLGSMTMAATCFAIAHNHNHTPMWRFNFLNKMTDYWLTLFYGFPPYVWKPTHNLNHHKFNNREGDYTITYRISEKNNILTFLSFPTLSGIYQQAPANAYLKQMWQYKRPTFFYYISQYVLLIGYLATAFYLDPFKALVYILIPQQFSINFVLLINYMQHVHCDEESEYNHSRNFIGFGSKFLLNNGLHTVHHMQMGLHWSKLPEAHAKVEHLIDPSLNERSMAWFIFRTYVLSIFFKKFRTESMRLARIEKEKQAATQEKAQAKKNRKRELAMA